MNLTLKLVKIEWWVGLSKSNSYARHFSRSELWHHRIEGMDSNLIFQKDN